MSTDQWREHYRALAADYWTDERLDELLRGKDLALTPRTGAPLLRAVGLLHRDGSMPPRQRSKYFQLNHMIRLLEPSLNELIATGEPLRVVDIGCGLSYLTMALAWHFEHVFQHPAEIIGIDRRTDVVDRSQSTAERLGLDNRLRFEAMPADQVAATDWLGEGDSVDAVVALHACDTATDDAIALGLAWDAKLIAVAPCCQAELAARWADKPAHERSAFVPVWQTPHLRRELGATITDAFRDLLLQAAGYQTWTVEFVGSEHTPKNTLIRGMRRQPWNDSAWTEYVRLRDATGGAEISLADAVTSRRASLHQTGAGR